MAYKKRSNKKCGDFGGKTYAGEPCPRYSGWGVRPRTREGPCKDHTEEAKKKRRIKKRRFLRLYVGNPRKTMQECCQIVGVSHDRLLDWREQDPEFKEAMLSAVDYIDEIRYVMVENSAFNQILAGDASASLVTFWLKNRAPHRWRDKVDIEATGKDGEALLPLQAIRSILSDADDEYVANHRVSPTRGRFSFN